MENKQRYSARGQLAVTALKTLPTVYSDADPIFSDLSLEDGWIIYRGEVLHDSELRTYGDGAPGALIDELIDTLTSVWDQLADDLASVKL